MAASDPNPRADAPSIEGHAYLSAAELGGRLEEEIGRAERHGTQLSLLLVVIEDLEEMAREHGSELPEQTLAYIAGALRRELRRFDRVGRPAEHELVILLPGADSPRGEMVGRRVLERVSTIKVEADGARRPLRVSLGLAAWRPDTTAAQLLARARAATRVGNGENGHGAFPAPGPAR